MIHLKGLTGAITARMIAIVTVSILIMSGLGYSKLFHVTEMNSSIRIDRAARAALALFTESLAAEFTPIREADGTPLAMRLREDSADSSLSFRVEFDNLLSEIGAINQGAANLFVFNSETYAFDRFATTFRKPDGSMPPPMSIESGHPAFTNIANNRPHIGEVPVMGRMRLAYIIPIQTLGGAVAGALAVDVGWADDLVTARNELRVQILVTVITILIFVAVFGMFRISKDLRPLRELASFADDLASGKPTGRVPHEGRGDEIGALSQGMVRVVELQRELGILAYTDDMTDLGNRRGYLKELEESFKKSVPHLERPTLLYLDIDNFKKLNDAHGQSTGNEILKIAAARLKARAANSGKVYRLTSDQFAILVDGKNQFEQVVQFAENVLEDFREPFQLALGGTKLTASIGVIWSHHDTPDGDEAHRMAGLALRAAKLLGGDQWLHFASKMDEELQDQVQMEKRLESAIINREIKIHFQPQIAPSTNALTGVEALARWSDSENGAILPSKFIPLAEATGQIVDLGDLVLDLACEQAAKWTEEGFDFKHIAVNVSPVQLWQCDFADKLKFTLDRHNLQASKIYLEVTESMFVDSNEIQIAAVLESICALGVKLSLDDFGSGYSSLGYLNRLPFDQLKIDRIFVSDVHKDARKQQVLRGILAFGHGLGFDLIVEGAETVQEVTLIEQMTSGSIQGYYYAEPVSAQQLPGIVLDLIDPKNSSKQRSA